MKSLKQIITKREFQFAQAVSEGATNREIAARLGISKQYVKQKLSLVYEKAGCSFDPGTSRPRIELAVRFAIEEERGLYA